MLSRVRSRVAVFLILFTVYAINVSATSARSPQNYDFAYSDDPYFASMTAELLKPFRRLRSVPVNIASLPGRGQLEPYRMGEHITLRLFAQPRPAPLVYLIPGFGGAPDGRMSVWIAQKLYDAGYSVLSLPSPLSWRFEVAESSTGIAGFTPSDARDLERVMIQGRAVAERRRHLKVTRVAMVGYSLGALEGAYIMRDESRHPRLHIERAVLMNPPIRMQHAMGELDHLYDVGERWSSNHRYRVLFRLLTGGLRAIVRDITNPSYFLDLRRYWHLSPEEAQYTIGMAFRRTFAESLVAGQTVTDLGIFRETTDFSRRLSDARHISFTTYLETTITPFWASRIGHSRMSAADLVAQGDFYSLKNFVIGNPRIYMMHNRDDFLNNPSEMLEIADRMGDRAIVYPCGGHLGNLWHAQNQADLLETLAPLRH